MAETLDLTQAAELSQLMELEACWENLREHPAPLRGSPTKGDLTGRQRAYEFFRKKLISYNRRYAPQHVPELLLNTPARLGKWCAHTGDLFRRVEAAPEAGCPVHLVEKACRRGESIARRMQKPPVPRQSPPDTIQAAIHHLEILSQWCAALEQSAG